ENLKNGMILVLSASYEDIRQIRYDIAFKMLLAVAVLVAVFSAVVVLIVSRIVGPLNKLTAASQQLAEGNYDIEIVQSDTYEIKVLSAAFELMTERLQEHKKVQHVLAYRDSLTGLRNATSYKSWVNDFNKEIQSKPMDFGVVIFDLNYLKETNDRYGHEKGNKLIVAASGIISRTFKRSPVFRIGGDEFLAILQNSDLEEYKELLIKLDSACIDASLKNEDEAFRLSIAKGFSRYNPATDAEFLDVFNRADDEMYKNKRTMKMKQEYLEGDHKWTTF
ncbi:MAG: diguanylate cyclase, partial [Lachnospiraceae bacterium]|nr:diguanylate cyclase [Lachnospiraceae bacterium]